MPRGLHIGTSGFSYDDWVGPFYPPGLAKSKWFEYYVQEFDCTEINATYYEWLATKAIAALAGRAPAGFRFAVKLHRSLTHIRKDLAAGIVATAEQNRPLEAGGMLAGHLAQFPPSFLPSSESWEYLKRLAGGVRPLCVEFRHSDWQTPNVAGVLKALDVSLVCVDAPALDGLPRWQPMVTASLAYVRFHGRNGAKWRKHDDAWERYNYLYTEEELSVRAKDVADLSERAQETLVLFNNHYGAQAVSNARQLAALLGVATSPTQPKLF